ncbi:hypothetical protein [Terrabacter terrigena]|uniref:Zinc-finger domain-containing protein n=1 Tax=Terrabacter terrigena TaxID=574718 RepID=A0ABW3MSH8_9MICO
MARVHDEHGDDRAAAAGDDRAGEAVLAAWRGLPSESRALLWRLVVHEDGVVRSTPAAGTTPHGPSGRGERARARLRLGLLSELVARAETPECAAARRRLGSHLRGSSWQPGRWEVDGHLGECPRCRTAVEVLADVDRAIRERVAPALLPGAFTTEPQTGDAVPAAAGPRDAEEAHEPGALGRLDGPERHGESEALNRLDLLHRVAGEVAGDTAGAQSPAARVLSFPGRPVSLVTAAASLALAATLYALGSVPGGAVTVDAPAGQGPPVSARTGPAEPAADPAAGPAAPAAAGRQQAIGVAVAESASGPRDVGTEPPTDAGPHTTAGGWDVSGAGAAAGGSAAALAPHTTRVGHGPIASSSTSQPRRRTSRSGCAATWSPR